MMEQQQPNLGYFKKQELSADAGTASLPSTTRLTPLALFRLSPWKSAFAVFLAALLVGLVLYTAWTDLSLHENGVVGGVLTYPSSAPTSYTSPLPLPFSPITWPNASKLASTCGPPPLLSSSPSFLNTDPSSVCPDYFRYIHDDLKPWSEHGITRQLVESANKTANFRLTVVDGRLYVTRYSPAYQTRDVFTWWGMVQLLRRYPVRLPNVDLMFDAGDRPAVRAADYPGEKRSQAPPLFKYCKDDKTLDIPFPDWSFWGWPEVNIKPWDPLSKEMEAANHRLPWSKREPYAFWKGNPSTSWTRKQLMKCNASSGKDWNARLFKQNWNSENKGGYKHSNLADQCNYRYKIYLDGIGWSVSQKYIMACDSMALSIDSRYIDFFTRGLEPLRHYWPIKGNARKYCQAIKFAVDWGNRNQDDARAIGKEGSQFLLRQLKMEYVYDYMFHVLSEYAKLLRYKPEVPPGAIELCVESMMNGRKALQKQFMEMSMVNVSSPSIPCTLPAPLDTTEVEAIRGRGFKARKQVDMWERQGS